MKGTLSGWTKRLRARILRRVPPGSPAAEARSPDADGALVAKLVFPLCRQARPGQLPALNAGTLRAETALQKRYPVSGGVCVASVCTQNHLHFARALAASLSRHHPGVPMFLAVADWDGAEPLEIEGVTPISGREIGGWHFDYMALKYSAVDLCCALKPYLLNHLL